MLSYRPSGRLSYSLSVLLAIWLCLVTLGVSVKHENFKTCDQSGFCKRNRAYADAAASSSFESPYTLDVKSLKLSNGILSGTILKNVDGADKVALPLTVSFLESGVARITIDEQKRKQGQIELRHGSKARKERYNDAEKWAIVGGTAVSKGAAIKESTSGITRVVYGPSGTFELLIHQAPLRFDFKRDGETQIQFNGRKLMNYEHWRPKTEVEPPKEGEEAKEAPKEESTWWEETFGGNTDSKPRGPEAVAIDIDFPGYEHVFGLAEHASPLSLKETRGGDGKYSDPYRLYNSDVFEYELDSPMTLYGSIPFLQAHREDSTVGVFWLNAAETWVDITRSKRSANPLSLGVATPTTTHSHWISESGLLDVFVILGPSPQDVLGAYTDLTGKPRLPQSFSIAYHQCRWNYVTDEDVKDVDRKFDKHSIPYDVIWLDIEYTDEKKYFTWDPLTFKDPIAMQKQLDDRERKLVYIIDPHIKNTGGYPVVEELKSKNLGVLNKDADLYEGWCWPGSSHWIDCFNPAAITWWKSLFRYDKFKGTSKNSWLWNDMNEPSVFNGPETTMPKDNLHHGHWEHRDVHNLNGMTLINASYEALLSRDKEEDKHPRRPFVLTRSFFSGAQRMAAVWTGDNEAKWDHLKASIPMMLSLGISGYPFAGADVGGFFGNPSKELLTRWYQTGIFYPFFRGHAHIDTRRREPYLIGEPYTNIITRAIRLRYSLLPAWYTAFHEASVTGAPVIRPNYYVHPSDPKGFAIDDQLYIGSTGLMTKPVTDEGTNFTEVYFAANENYYDYFDYWIYEGPRTEKVFAPLDIIPLFLQGGNIIPRRDRPRRSSGLMKYDPLTLVVAVSRNGDAVGTLYLDDGESFDYEERAYIHRRFSFSSATGVLSSEDLNPGPSTKKAKAYLDSMEQVVVGKVIVIGAPNSWQNVKEVEITEDVAGKSAPTKKAALEWRTNSRGKAAWAVVKNPAVRIGSDWKIQF